MSIDALALPHELEPLLQPAAYPHAVASPLRVVSTNTSFVLLSGELAYKVRRATVLPQLGLDFTTLARRWDGCRNELQLNRRYAPQLYRGLAAARPGDGRPGEPVLLWHALDTPRRNPADVEYAVVMQQFDPSATLAQLALQGQLTAEHVDLLVQRMVALHEQGERYDGAEQICSPGLLEGIVRDADLEQKMVACSGQSAHRDFVAALSAALPPLVPLQRQRQQQGWVRKVHGDLQLSNIAVVAGEIQPFDCLDFNVYLRRADVIYDAAITYADLHAHGVPELAEQFHGAYVAAMQPGEVQALFQLYVACRAAGYGAVAWLQAQDAASSAQERRVAARLAEARFALALQHASAAAA